MGVGRIFLLVFFFGLACLFWATGASQHERRAYDWVFYLAMLAGGFASAALGFGMLLAFGMPWGMVSALVMFYAGIWLGGRVGRALARRRAGAGVQQ